MKYNKNKISAVIPAKNEGEGIKKVIRSLRKYCSEIILIDGHSRDNTKDIALNEGAKFFLDNRKGRGEAVRLGIEKAEGEIIVIVDADGSPNYKDIPKLVNLISQKKADMVICSRRTGGSFDFAINADGILRTAGSDLLTYLVNKKFNTNFSDILYSFRAFKKSSVKDLMLTANEFDLEQEMIVKAIKKDRIIVEIPSREYARAWGKSKLRTIAGIKLLLSLILQLYW